MAKDYAIAFESFEPAGAVRHSPDCREAVAPRAPVASADAVVVTGLD